MKKIYSLADDNGFLPGDDKNINLTDILDFIINSYKLGGPFVRNRIESLYERAKKYICDGSNIY